MLEAQTISDYGGFNPDSNPLHDATEISCATNTHVVDMAKYINLDKENRKQEKSNLKRSIRRRVEKVRNLRSSDMESDTGSDGLAVNSEGSGRSGDWGPPKIRRKSRSYRKRQEARTSLTDSGISLSKTDLDSLSGLSLNTHSTPEYRQLNSYQRILHNAYARQQCKLAERQASSATEDSSLEQRHDKGFVKYPVANQKPPTCEGLESNKIEGSNNNEPERSQLVASDAERVPPVARDNERPVSRDIEEKEKAILEQCIKNEKLSGGDGNPCNYVVDCSDTAAGRESRFPLPDHLNYPICRYRIKTESNGRMHPLKRLKNGWKKLKSKTKKQDNTPDTDCYPEFYPDFRRTEKEEDDNEAIMSRLSRNPTNRRNFAKRVFDRFGSKSYSINANDNFDDVSRGGSRMSRSGSTRSVPDALQDMWNKVHYKEDAPCEQPTRKTLHKVISMPSIHTETQRGNFERENYFNQIGNHTETNMKSNIHYKSDKNLSTGNDLIDRLTGLQITQQDTNCVGKSDRKVCFNDTTSNYYDDFRCSPDPAEGCGDEAVTNSLTRSPKKYASCHELYQRPNVNQNAKYVVPPQLYYQPNPPCACCIQGQQQVQFVPFYPQYPANYMYQVPPYGGYPPMEFLPNFYPMNAVQGFYQPNNEHAYMVNGAHAPRVDNVVPPLDVKVEHEKKAEKRKISEMVFDTFV